MKTENWNFPDGVRLVIEGYYANPVKTGSDGKAQDIGLFSLTKEEAFTLAELVYAHSPTSSLEIGLGAASSCIAISAARKEKGLVNRHVVLDPHQITRSSSLGLMEISKCGLAEYVQWVAERSEDFLSGQAKNQQYDLVFIDGAHDIGQTVTDAFYSHRVLNPAGLVIFHDALLFSTSAAVRYLSLECDYGIVTLKPDSSLKRFARMIRYSHSLGTWYATRVIPKMHRSLVALRKSQ